MAAPRMLVLALLSLPALSSCCGGGDGLPQPEPFDIGLDVDLRAIVPVHASVEDREYTGLALAEGGALARIGDPRYDPDHVADLHPIADVELRALWSEDAIVWVVGDDGFVAVSADLGESWAPVDVGVSADLHAILSVGSRLVIVGDEVVRSQGLDGSWSEPALIDGSWGQLRAVAWDERRIYAVGLDGVILSAGDPGGEWVRESSGTSHDLFAVSVWDDADTRVFAAGAGGTLLERGSGSWTSKKTRQTVNLVDFANGLALASDGRIFRLRDSGKLKLLSTLSGARVLVENGPSEVLVVGDDGLFAESQEFLCVY